MAFETKTFFQEKRGKIEWSRIQYKNQWIIEYDIEFIRTSVLTLVIISRAWLIFLVVSSILPKTHLEHLLIFPNTMENKIRNKDKITSSIQQAISQYPQIRVTTLTMV